MPSKNLNLFKAILTLTLIVTFNALLFSTATVFAQDDDDYPQVYDVFADEEEVDDDPIPSLTAQRTTSPADDRVVADTPLPTPPVTPKTGPGMLALLGVTSGIVVAKRYLKK